MQPRLPRGAGEAPQPVPAADRQVSHRPVPRGREGQERQGLLAEIPDRQADARQGNAETPRAGCQSLRRVAADARVSGRSGARRKTRLGDRRKTRLGARHSTRFGARYSTRFGARYSTRFGARYSTRFGARYSTRFGAPCSTRFGARYSTRFGARAWRTPGQGSRFRVRLDDKEAVQALGLRSRCGSDPYHQQLLQAVVPRCTRPVAVRFPFTRQLETGRFSGAGG